MGETTKRVPSLLSKHARREQEDWGAEQELLGWPGTLPVLLYQGSEYGSGGFWGRGRSPWAQLGVRRVLGCT